ncbi:MAG: hypothetical protein ACREUP_07020, partial [Burkholderiales bacterium]
MRHNPALVRSVRLPPDLAGAVTMADAGVSHPGRLISPSVRSAITTRVTRARPPEGGHYDSSTGRRSYVVSGFSRTWPARYVVSGYSCA